jgi:hypothetical protein
VRECHPKAAADLSDRPFAVRSWAWECEARDQAYSDCTPFIVANFSYQSPSQSTFCDVEKRAAPRMRENPVTIFSGKNASGKAREVVFQNVTCVIYTSSSEDEERIVGAAISAMRQLGGKRVGPY